MNTETHDNKEATVAIVLAAISVLFVASISPPIPSYALGHWHEGDEESNAKDDTAVIATEEGKELVTCLADTQEGNIPTQDEIDDCLNIVRGVDEDVDDNISINDDDGIIVSDDDPESDS